MKIAYLEGKNGPVAVVRSGETVIFAAASALELAMTARHEGNARRLVTGKEAAAEDFFVPTREDAIRRPMEAPGV